MLQHTKNDTPCAKTSKKLQQDGRKDTIMIKPNPIPAGWVTHKLENSNINSSLTVVKVLSLHQASQHGDPAMGLRIPQNYDFEGQRDFTSMGLGETETWLLEGTNKRLHGPGPKGKEKWPHRRLSQISLAVLGGLLQSCGSTGACHRGTALAAAVLGGAPWWEPSWKPPLTHHRACRFQGWVASGQITTRKGA